MIAYHLLITYLRVLLLVIAKGRAKRSVLLMLLVIIDQNCKLRVEKTSLQVAIGRGRRCVMMLSP